MSDVPHEETGRHERLPEEIVSVLDQLRSTPFIVSGAATQTKFNAPATTSASAVSTTLVADIHALAENLMFDATKLVAVLDSSHEQIREAKISEKRSELVSVEAVLRAGAAVTGGFAIVCGLGTYLGGVVLLHPLLALLLLVASLGFYLMSLLPRN
jgi:hypothetical protein